MKTKEELNALKKEVEKLNKKLAELTDEELKEVIGGYNLSQNKATSVSYSDIFSPAEDQPKQYDIHIYGKDDPKFIK